MTAWPWMMLDGGRLWNRRVEGAERFFNKLKHFRAIATRYDKLATNFLAGVQLACAMILLN